MMSARIAGYRTIIKESHLITAELLKSVLERSILEANAHYEMLTGGEWLSDRGVESIVAYHVSKAIKDVLPKSHYVIPEVTVNQIEKKLSVSLKGRRSTHFRKGNRIDVVLTNNANKPFGVVELKRDRFTSIWKKDADRVVYLVKTLDHIKIGAFAVFIGEKERQSGKSFIHDNMPDVTTYLAALGDVFRDRKIHCLELNHVTDGVRRVKPWTGTHRRAVAGFILRKS
jgi:hypothetical protein